jgi:hypothetical protein
MNPTIQEFMNNLMQKQQSPMSQPFSGMGQGGVQSSPLSGMAPSSSQAMAQGPMNPMGNAPTMYGDSGSLSFGSGQPSSGKGAMISKILAMMSGG